MADWTPEEDAIVKRMWCAGVSGGRIAERLVRKSRSAVISRCIRQGWKRGEPAEPKALRGCAAAGVWTDEQREFLLLNWRQMQDDELAEGLSQIGPARTRGAVEEQRLALRLKRPKGYQLDGDRVNRTTPEEVDWPPLKGKQEQREALYLQRLFEGLKIEHERIAARALAKQEAA